MKDIYSHKPGKEEFSKSQRSTLKAPNGVSSILNGNKEEHARYRRLLAAAFSEKGHQSQSEHIRYYVDLLIDRFRERARSGTPTEMVDWLNMVTFDTIGDLGKFTSRRDHI
jgi:cytochrome P450